MESELVVQPTKTSKRELVQTNATDRVSDFITNPIKREVIHYTVLAILSVTAPPLVPVAEFTYNLLTYGKPAYTIISKAIEIQQGRGDTADNLRTFTISTADLVMSKLEDTITNYTVNMIGSEMCLKNTASSIILKKLVLEPTISNAYSYGVDAFAGDITNHVISAAVSMMS